MTPFVGEWLDACEARAEAATGGPWVLHHRHSQAKPGDDEMSGLGLEIEGPPEADLRGQFALWADADFIAHARTDLPLAVAALRAVLALHVEDEVRDKLAERARISANPFEPWEPLYRPSGDCGACGEDWPCATVRAVAEVLG